MKLSRALFWLLIANEARGAVQVLVSGRSMFRAAKDGDVSSLISYITPITIAALAMVLAIRLIRRNSNA